MKRGLRAAYFFLRDLLKLNEEQPSDSVLYRDIVSKDARYRRQRRPSK